MTAMGTLPKSAKQADLPNTVTALLSTAIAITSLNRARGIAQYSKPGVDPLKFLFPPFFHLFTPTKYDSYRHRSLHQVQIH
jgi:hypothetical protein